MEKGKNKTNLVIVIEKRLNLSEAPTAAEGTKAAARQSAGHVCLQQYDCCTLQSKVFTWKMYLNITEDYIPKVFLPVQNNNNKYVVINFYSYLVYACTDLDI